MDTFILDVSDIPARNSGEVMCQLLSSQLADFRHSRHCGAGHCYSRSKEAVAKAIGAIYSRTKEAFRGNISGKHIDLTRQGNCLRQSLALKPTLAITRFDIRRNRSRETFRRKSNLIRDRQILHFCQSKKTFRIGKLSHSLTLSFFGFGLFRETNSAHAVMTSSRLHFTLDKTALTCCIHSLKDMQSLQSAAIRSSCTSVPRRGLQSYDA